MDDKFGQRAIKVGSKVFLVTHQCQGDLLPSQLGFNCGQREVRSEGLELKGMD